MLKLAVLISGGGSNLKALIDAAKSSDYPAEIVCVGSDTDAAGLAYAEAEGIPSFVIRPSDYASREEWGVALAAAIQEHLGAPSTGYDASTHADQAGSRTESVPPSGLVVSAGLMRILPPGFVRAFSPNLINTHPALLPLFPGAHAVRDALAAGATETGVTVHVIDEGVDTGPVVRQAVIAIHPGETEEELHERIKQRERPLLVETVRAIAEGAIVLQKTSAAGMSESRDSAVRAADPR